MTNFAWASAQSGNWDQTDDWLPSGTPGSGDHVSINAVGASYTVAIDDDVAAGTLSLDTGAATLSITDDGVLTLGTGGDDVVAGGLLDVFAGSLQLGAKATLEVNAGTLELDSQGVISGGAIAANGGKFDWAGGELDDVTFLGNFDLSGAGASVQIGAGGATFEAPSGSKPGSIGLTGAGAMLSFDATQTLDNVAVTFGDDATGGASEIFVNNAPGAGATLTLGAGALIVQSGNAIINGNSDDDVVVNSGTIEADASSGTLNIETVGFTNSGTIDVSNGDTVAISGVLNNLNGGTLGGGTYIVEAGSSLLLNDDEIVQTLATDVVLEGAGSNFQSLDATLTGIAQGGELELTDGRNFDAGSDDIVNSGTLDVEGVTFTAQSLTDQNGATLRGYGTIAANYSGSGSSIVVTGGTLTFSGSDDMFADAISGSGTLAITGASASFALGASVTAGNLVVGGSGGGTMLTADDDLTIAGNFSLEAGSTLSVGGNFTISGTDSILGAVTGGGTLIVGGGATTFGAGAQFSADDFAQTGGMVVFDESLEDATALDQTAGTITIAADETLTLAGGGSLSGTVAGAGTLSLSQNDDVFGAVTLDVAHVGLTDDILSLDDDLTYSGALTEDGASTINIGADDKLGLSGKNTLAGTIDGGELDISGGVTTLYDDDVVQLTEISVAKSATLDIAPGAATGSVLGAAIANSGTIVVGAGTVTAGTTITFDDALTQSATGVVKIENGVTLALDSKTSGGEIQFGGGSDDILAVDEALAGGSSFGSLIVGFGVGDGLELIDDSITGVSDSLVNGNTQVSATGAGDFTFTLVGDYTSGHFTVADDDIINFSATPVAPTITGAASTVKYSAGSVGQKIEPSLAVGPVFDQINGAVISISSGFLNGDQLVFVDQNGITGAFNDGVLTLSGTANVATYSLAIDSILYTSSNPNPNNSGHDASRTITISVATPNGLHSSAVSTTLDIVIPPPGVMVTASGDAYVQGGTPADLASHVGVVYQGADASGAIVSIVKKKGLRAGDQLSFTQEFGISGTYDASTGVLTLKGKATIADYEQVLESVAFSSTSLNPTDYGTDLTRAIVWRLKAGGGASLAADSTVDVVAVDQPAVFVHGGNTVSYAIKGSATVVDPKLKVKDVDSRDLSSATISISQGFAVGDVLSAASKLGIESSYNAVDGVLTLEGAATLKDYDIVLKSVTFSSGAFTTNSRTVSWVVNDGEKNSSPVTTTVDVIPAPPQLLGATAADIAHYTRGGSAVTLDPGLIIEDPGATTLTKAVVAISQGFEHGDVLAVTAANGITETYDSSTGRLILTGTASLADYQALLDEVTFATTAGGSSRNISWKAVNQVSGGAKLTSAGETTKVSIGGAPSAHTKAEAPTAETAVVVNGGVVGLDGASASDRTISFGAGGTLALSDAEDFAGTIEGFSTASAVDLLDFRASATVISGVTGTGALGTTTDVTLTDASDRFHVTLALFNAAGHEFGGSAADYSLAADSGSVSAGTLFRLAAASG